MYKKFELKVAKWEESNLNGFNKETPITRVSTCFETPEDTDGKFTVEYIMVSTEYDISDKHNSKTDYLGFMEFCGTLDGKKGTFVIEDHGVYENSVPKSDFKIKEHTGTGELKGITGTGKYYADNETFIMELEYFIKTV
ncbi:MAG: DUF3224 domain-containing protein [Tannerellaceae bacterium]|jgi:hypothetical protein|nr:DUF3224 domain-containing protein [Tannerellaceae bacterium]